MKKVLLSIILLSATVTLMAQPAKKGEPEGEPSKIESMISDLSTTQKNRIDVITRRSQKNIESYKHQLTAVRDSIKVLMDKKEDLSAIVLPLYEREARLQCAINKEYYLSKVAIDQVLTKKQYDELQSKMKTHRKRGAKEHGGQAKEDNQQQKPGASSGKTHKH